MYWLNRYSNCPTGRSRWSSTGTVRLIPTRRPTTAWAAGKRKSGRRPSPSLLHSKQCCGSWIRCLFDPGWVKSQDPDPGWTIGSYFRKLRNHFFGLKYLNSLMRVRDGKIRIRDKHPGSATLILSRVSFRLLATYSHSDSGGYNRQCISFGHLGRRAKYGTLCLEYGFLKELILSDVRLVLIYIDYNAAILYF